MNDIGVAEHIFFCPHSCLIACILKMVRSLNGWIQESSTAAAAVVAVAAAAAAAAAAAVAAAYWIQLCILAFNHRFL